VWDVQRMLPSFGNKILTGKAYTHLYFVFISIQLYVLFPIILFLFQRFRWLAASAIVVGIALQWGFLLWNREFWQVPNRGSWSPTYFGQYFLGAWLGIYFDRVRSWLVITKDKVTRSRVVVWIVLWGAWLASGIYYVSIFYQARAHKAAFHNALYDALWDIYTMLTPIVLIQLAFLISRGIQSPIWIRGLRHLGIVSFGVYLFHPLVLLVYRKFPLHGGSPLEYHIWYAGGFMCALILSWAVVTFLSRLTGWSWVLFGSVPAQLRAADTSKGEPITRRTPSASA
jgi:peptidoglycan/LPS O-acetylase OafA/YrhL